MAIIKCYECGQNVSDKASVCPHCGAPMRASVPPTPNVAPQSIKPITTPPVPAGPQVGMKTELLTCPGCGARLESKDVLSSGWAHCPKCHKDVQLAGINSAFSDQGIIEKIYPDDYSKDKFHVQCMQKLMDEGPEDVFENLKVIKTTRKYFWVREFGMGQKRQIIPMSRYGTQLFSGVWGQTLLDSSLYENVWSTEKMVGFSSSQLKGGELVPKEISSFECKHQYSINKLCKNLPATDAYYCLPVLEETVEYKGNQYVFQAVNPSDETGLNWSDAKRPKDDDVIGKSPKYISENFAPCTYLAGAILIVLALSIVWSIVSSLGIIWTIILGVLLGSILFWIATIAGVALMAIPVGIDTLIRASINVKRREKFRQKYKDIQLKKQADAKRLFNLDLTFTIPNWPLSQSEEKNADKNKKNNTTNVKK